jgi:iron complex transport system substrate-binding protein
MRIVSLVPAATEALCALGLAADVVGRSHECDEPEVQHAAVVSESVLPAHGPVGEALSPRAIDDVVRSAMQQRQPLYRLDADRLAALRPDLIVTQDLCHVCSIDADTVRRIAARLPGSPAVVSLNPTSVEDVLEDLLTLGRATGHEHRATDLVVSLRSRLYSACDYVNGFLDGPRVVFLEWTDPLYVAGYWTPQLIERAGGAHPLNPSQAKPTAGAGAGPTGMTLRAAGRGVVVPAQVLAATRPEVIIISPCGVPLEHIAPMVRELAREPWWQATPAVQARRVALIDGNRPFSRPGPGLVDGFEWLVGYLNDRPEVISPRVRWSPWTGYAP